ncbi:2-dehydro-3-deoxygalactonokinase [Glaciecola sp. 2405UD65-10]|uniref:2-dehydro-3-deoxygalactonokinase n=1 Tax=Glaciecola sp. 2405UD65-10 TaxID=3397244 RepID=UPI003B5C73D5
MEPQQLEYLIIDWGTTNFRAFAIGTNETLVDTKSLPLGFLQVSDGNFAGTLETILNEWGISYHNLPIYMAGMVGSAQGWHNVPYTETPVSSESLSAKTFSFQLPWGAKAYIVPGVSHVYDEDKYDVMRGEEVQVIGLAEIKESANFQAILPGTHSKHVVFDSGEITRFASFMTGEFYSIIAQHSLLGKGLADADAGCTPAFEKGVRDAQKGQLTNFIFLARTRRLFEQVEERDVKTYMSGLLIGYELKELKNRHIYIVGGQSLSANYKLACDLLNLQAEVLDGNQCFLAGMSILRRKLK